MRWFGAIWFLLLTPGGCALPPSQFARAPEKLTTRVALDRRQSVDRPTANLQLARPGKSELRLAQAQEQIPPGIATPDALPIPLDSMAPPQPSTERPTPGDWSLQQLTNLALDDHPILRRARARITQARGAALQAGFWANPRWDTNNPQVLGVGNQNAYNAGFQTEIPVKGKKRLDREAAQRLVREAEYGGLSDRYDVLQAVRQQFYAALAQQRRVEISGEIVRIATGARNAAQRMYDAGLVPETDVLLLTLELQKAETQLLEARTLLIGRRRQLAAAVARPDLPLGDLSGDLAGPPPRFDVREVYQFVAMQNVDVLSAETEVARTRTLLRRAQVEPYPNLYSGPAQQWGVPSHSPNNQFWYNFAFNIVIWDRNQGNIRAAEANIVDATATVPATRNKLIKQAADALGRHRAALQAAERIRLNVLPTARRNQELVQKGYREGLLPVAQVFQAQRALFQANLDYIDALDDVWSSSAELGNLLQLERFP